MSRTEAHYPESRRDYRQDKTRRERIRDRLAADDADSHGQGRRQRAAPLQRPLSQAHMP